MRHIIAPIIFLLIMGLCYSSQLPDFPFVFAHGKAEIKVPPDIATIHFGVEEFNEDPAIALAVVQNVSAELISFFAEQKIEKKDIIGYQIEKDVVRDSQNYEDLEILGYELRQVFSVTIRNLSQYEPFMKKLLALKNLVGIRAEFDRTDRKKIETNLITEASADAKHQAELIAQAFGAQLGPVHAISQRGFQELDAEFGVSIDYDADRYMYAPGIGEKEFLFVPSTITLRSSVKVVFNLEQKK